MLTGLFAEIESLIVHGVQPVGRLGVALLAHPEIMVKIDEARASYEAGKQAGAVNWLQLIQMIMAIVAQILPVLFPTPIPTPTPTPTPAK
ncbi:MAG: hypothetical protein KGL39_49425 [Patescibacteria group bacterium]|nr:hypothetical protein [Patescibacteria group bacterium]